MWDVPKRNTIAWHTSLSRHVINKLNSTVDEQENRKHHLARSLLNAKMKPCISTKQTNKQKPYAHLENKILRMFSEFICGHYWPAKMFSTELQLQHQCFLLPPANRNSLSPRLWWICCWTGADRVCPLVSNLLAALSSPPPPPCLGCWKAVIDENTVGEGGWKMLRPCGAPLKGDTQTHTRRHTHLCKNTNNVLHGCQLSEPPLSWLTESPTYTRSPPFTIVPWWSAGSLAGMLR